MKRHSAVILSAGLLATALAWSQPQGHGPGMMGGGYGGGPGMGDGYGMGPGMMWGYSPDIPNLSNEQRAKIGDIQKEFRRKQWDLMEKMHDSQWNAGNPYRDGKFDEQAARKRYDVMAALHKQMFENSLEERKRIDSVLTPQQREQMQRGYGSGSR